MGGCGCNARAGATSSSGQTIKGYRVVLGDQVYPPLDKAPYFSRYDAQAQVRALGGGSVKQIVT